MRKVIIAAAAILLLAGGAMFAVYWQSGDPGPGADSPPAPPPVEIPATALPPQAQADIGRMVAGTPNSPPLSPPIEYGPPPIRAPPGTWEAIPPAPRLSGPIGQALARGLGELRSRMSGCFDEITQTRYGQLKVSETAEEFTSGDQGGETTILMLHVETLRDAVRIADAPVEARGGASDGLIACIQQVLIGQTFPAPGVTAGTRHRFMHGLSQ